VNEDNASNQSLAERVSRLEERWELSVQIARLEERINAAAQAVPLVAEPLKVQALELSRRVVGLEQAKNESAGKSSGVGMSWGIIATLAGLGLTVVLAGAAVVALLMSKR
jgi:hypothetical protein